MNPVVNVRSQRHVLTLAIAATLCLAVGSVAMAVTRPRTPTLRDISSRRLQITSGRVQEVTVTPSGRTLRVMSYNIHHGAGIDGVVDLDRIAEAIRSANPDILLLTEVDTHWRRSDFIDQGRALAEKLELPYAFAADTILRRNPYDAGFLGVARYGLVLLSRYPTVWANSTPLPMNGLQEPRVALTADIELGNGSRLRVIGTHLGLDHDTRMAQADTLLKLLDDWRGPSILMGDFNAGPDSLELLRLTGADLAYTQGPVGQDGSSMYRRTWKDPAVKGGPPTFPATNPVSRIDFILATDDLSPHVTRYESPATLASDHLPVWMEINL